MKFTPHVDENGQAYWLVEIRAKDRVLLAEGDSFSAAVNNAVELISDTYNITLPYLGAANA